ncbi:hypothetical protein D3C87_1893130 [compost metagenome]
MFHDFFSIERLNKTKAFGLCRINAIGRTFKAIDKFRAFLLNGIKSTAARMAKSFKTCIVFFWFWKLQELHRLQFWIQIHNSLTGQNFKKVDLILFI